MPDDANTDVKTIQSLQDLSPDEVNAENKLATAIVGSETITYTYDGDGTLVMKTDAGGVTRYVGPHYETTTPNTLAPAPNSGGVACLDGATGTGYIMYSEESVHARFGEHPPNGGNAYHYICVKYDNGWVYDSNLAYYPFDPQLTDILIAAVNFTNDTVAMLAGTDTYEHGIAKGYGSGNLSFTANMWYGAGNYGEFGITGSSFTPNSTVVKTYMLGGQRVATKRNGTLFYLHGDHGSRGRELSSASLTTDASGGVVSEMRYYAYGATRSGSVPTDRRYTGQREDTYTQLYDYNARYYDAYINRWIQPDTIIPDPENPQTLNRYSYVNNNPLRYTDPTGHNGTDGGVPAGNSSDPSIQLDREQLENELYIISLIQAGRWEEYRSFIAFMQKIHPGSIGIYKWSGLLPGPGDVGHAVIGADEGVFIGTGGFHDSHGVYMSSAAAIYQSKPLLSQLEIYEVEGIDDQGREDAARFAIDTYGAGYSYMGIWPGSGETPGNARKWYCTELTVKALEEGDVTFYQGNGVLYGNRFPPILPWEMQFYRTTAGSDSAAAITTRWGNADPLKQTWP